MVMTKTKEEKTERPSLVSTWKEVSRKQKGLVIAMGIVILMSIALLVFSFTALRPQNTVVIVGYGDVYGEIAGISGGYRRDSWVNMLAFPILAVVYGVVHNLLVLRVYRRYGKDTALMVAVATMLLIVGTFVILLRLLGEW